MDAVFDEDFTSPLCTPDLPFIGVISMRDTKSNHQNDFPTKITALLANNQLMNQYIFLDI